MPRCRCSLALRSAPMRTTPGYSLACRCLSSSPSSSCSCSSKSLAVSPPRSETSSSPCLTSMAVGCAPSASFPRSCGTGCAPVPATPNGGRGRTRGTSSSLARRKAPTLRSGCRPAPSSKRLSRPRWPPPPWSILSNASSALPTRWSWTRPWPAPTRCGTSALRWLRTPWAAASPSTACLLRWYAPSEASPRARRPPRPSCDWCCSAPWTPSARCAPT